MPVYKNEDNGTWYVMTWYTNWKGEHKQKCKRGFPTKHEAQEWERTLLLLLLKPKRLLRFEKGREPGIPEQCRSCGAANHSGLGGRSGDSSILGQK